MGNGHFVGASAISSDSGVTSHMCLARAENPRLVGNHSVSAKHLVFLKFGKVSLLVKFRNPRLEVEALNGLIFGIYTMPGRHRELRARLKGGFDLFLVAHMRCSDQYFLP